MLRGSVSMYCCNDDQQSLQAICWRAVKRVDGFSWIMMYTLNDADSPKDVAFGCVDDEK